MQNKQTILLTLKNLFSKKIIKVMGALCVTGIIGYSEFNYHTVSAENQRMYLINQNDQQIIEQLNNEKQELIKQNITLTETNQKLAADNEELTNKINEFNKVNKSNEHASESYHTNAIKMQATCYGGAEGWTHTADGTYIGNLPLSAGIVASNDYPLGTKLYITCDSYPEVNGYYIVRDRGGMSSGVIDIWLGADATYADMSRFGRRTIYVSVIK